MKLLSTINVLKLSPLFRLFRERVEAKELPLEESVRVLSYESELIVQKLRWLLPNAAIPEDKPEDAEEIISAGGTAEEELVPVMDRREIDEALALLEAKMDGEVRSFARGRIPAFEGGRELIVAGIDPEAVRRSLNAALTRTGARDRVFVVPRRSFVTHLRDFWREVRRLTAKGALVRFSRFLGESKEEAILNFLAFLELVKRRRLRARQSELFGDIEFSARDDEANREGVS